MTSDGRLALISNFGDSKVFFVDLGSGTPVVGGMAKIDFFAEDIAIDPTDTWAMVTDGGFPTAHRRPPYPHPHLGPGRSGSDTHKPYSWRMVVDEGDPNIRMPTIGYANAVAIASDGRTVIVADYFGGCPQCLPVRSPDRRPHLPAVGKAVEIRHRRKCGVSFHVSPRQRRHLARRPDRAGCQLRH